PERCRSQQRPDRASTGLTASPAPSRSHAVMANQRDAPSGRTVAIIGSGPSGCYTAQFLRKELPDAEITIFEALPVPYGLVRYGVAADHQGTKAVAAQFDRMFDRANITFVGN